MYVPSREEAIFERLAAASQGPLTAGGLRAIYREVISASIALQKELVVAYLGPQATFTHQAALKTFGTATKTHPCATIPDVFTAVERGEAEMCIRDSEWIRRATLPLEEQQLLSDADMGLASVESEEAPAAEPKA